MRASELLAHYVNGNTSVHIYDDGSKIREYEGSPLPLFPESVDIKITDFCNAGCSFCHEQSTTKGKHGDLNTILNLIEGLPAGVELAIGGGNPLSHPHIELLLITLKEKGIIANLTINQAHLKPYKALIDTIIGNELAKGIGVSLTKKNLDVEYLPKTSNLVFHIIAGIQEPTILNELLKLEQSPKVLILGYKEYGFGKAFMNDEIKNKLSRWNKNLSKYFGKLILSFDNLAIKQLDLRRHFTKEGWASFYMGDDGTFTMYVDAVTETYAISSTKERMSTQGKSIPELFKNIQEIN